MGKNNADDQKQSESDKTLDSDAEESADLAEEESSALDTDKGKAKPGPPKVGEGPGNLRRRSDWFQKRHGR